MVPPILDGAKLGVAATMTIHDLGMGQHATFAIAKYLHGASSSTAGK